MRMSRILLAILMVTLSAAHGWVQATCVNPPPWTAPIPGIQQCTVGGFLLADIEAALNECEPGCNLYFPAGDYIGVAIVIPGVNTDTSMPRDFSDFAMYGAGMGQTILYAPIYTVDEPMHPEKMFNPIIEVSGDAPDGVVIKNMTLDGRRKDQTTPTNEQRCWTGPEGHAGQDNCDDPILPATPTTPARCWHNLVEQAAGIYTGTPNTEKIRRGGEIRDVEVKEMLGAQGIFLREAEEWTVKDNWVHNLGCHDVDANCPNLTFEPTPNPPGPDYIAADCWVDNVTHRWTNAAGIQIGQNCSDILVENNTVGQEGRDSQYGATKVGIATHKSGGPGCVTGSPTDITIRGNTINRSGSGAFVNGGCRVIFEDNIAQGSIDSGREDESGAFGFGCTDGGEGSEWHDNTSQDNQASGFFIACRQGGLLFEGNLASNNCVGFDGSIADLHFSGKDQLMPPACMVVAANHSYSDACWAAMNIADFTDVTVTGGRLTVGREYGLRMRDVNGVEVERTHFLDNGVEDEGIRLDNDPPSISNTYIQNTIDMHMDIEDPIVPFDPFDGCLSGHDPDVAYCDQEPGCGGEPDPECCDNVGSSNDFDCPSYGSCYQCPANATLDCGGPGCQTTQSPEACPAVPIGSHGCLLQDDGLWLECASNEEVYLVTCDCESIPPGNVCQASTSFVQCR